MLGKIKTAIQDKLYQNCIEEYREALRYQGNPYLVWIRETEQRRGNDELREESYPSLTVVYMEQCGSDFSLEKIPKTKDIVLFVSQEGKISVRAFREITKYFAEHDKTNLVYADEDIWSNEEDKGQSEDENVDSEALHRICPWIKPDWSPDTLFSFQYFGNIFAVRRNAFKDIEWLGSEDYKKNIYDFLLKATENTDKPSHIEKILFHRFQRGNNRESIMNEAMNSRELLCAGEEFDSIREAAMKRRRISGKMVFDQKQGLSYPVYDVLDEPLVSIVIPSKDNLEVLKQCINSVNRLTEYKNYEIIVVDNGSTAQVRMSLQSFSKEASFVYLYEPMEFNFSKMCNIGVSKAKGDYIMLLNDDMEVIDGTWLGKMLGQAELKHVGTVGAKLLYPDSTWIQHAGITNTCSGPGHKLKKMDDNGCYYYGKNKLIHDMIGVTAACLLIRKDRYKAMGGLYEGLQVAYNDVDLCFRIHEQGLYNVQRNDVVLYHHESFSRGDDMQDKAKFERLMAEKEILYQRHPQLYQYDPFNGTIMNNGEPTYECRMLEPYEFINLTGYHDEVREGKKIPKSKRVNQAIMIVVEDCEKEKFKKIDEKAYYFVKGWAYIPGADNARYKLKLLFENEQGMVWEIPIIKQHRKDVAAILPHEKNVEMTGFCCWIQEGSLPKGSYELWLTAKDCCSRQVLYRDANKRLDIS